jgi:hypothetical protein
VIKKGECGRMCYSALEPSRKKAKSVTASVRCADVGSLAATVNDVMMAPEGQVLTEKKKIACEQMAVIHKVIAGPEGQASVKGKELVRSQTATVGELTVGAGGQTPVDDDLRKVNAAVIDIVVDETERTIQVGDKERMHMQVTAIGEVMMDMGLEQASVEEDELRHVRIAAIDEVQTEGQEQVVYVQVAAIGEVIMEMGLEQASVEEDELMPVRIAAIDEVQTEGQEQVVYVQVAAIGEVMMDMGLEQTSVEEDELKHVRIAAIDEVQSEGQEQVEDEKLKRVATTVGDLTAVKPDEQAPKVNRDTQKVQTAVVGEVTELERLGTSKPGAVQTAVTSKIMTSHKGQASVRKLEPKLESTVSVSATDSVTGYPLKQVLVQEQEPMIVRDQFHFSEDQLPMCGKLIMCIAYLFFFIKLL